MALPGLGGVYFIRQAPLLTNPTLGGSDRLVGALRRSLSLPLPYYLERMVQKARATGMALDLTARSLWNTPRPQEQDSVGL